MSEPTVFVGLDVGKGEHHCTALNTTGERPVDRPLPNDEAALRALFTDLSKVGEVVVVVDQSASIGALPAAVAVAVDMVLATAYLPELAMRRIADLHPGTAKTDARDAFVIADAAPTLPHTLRSVDIAGPAMADLSVLMGCDDDPSSGHRRHQPDPESAAQRPPALEQTLGLNNPRGHIRRTSRRVTRWRDGLSLVLTECPLHSHEVLVKTLPVTRTSPCTGSTDRKGQFSRSSLIPDMRSVHDLTTAIVARSMTCSPHEGVRHGAGSCGAGGSLRTPPPRG